MGFQAFYSTCKIFTRTPLRMSAKLMLIKKYFGSQMTSHVWGVKIKIQGITVGGFLDAFGEAYALRGPLKCVIAESFTWSAADQWDHTSQTIIEQHDEIWSEVHLALTETSLEAAGTLKGNWGRLRPLGVRKGRMVRLGVDLDRGVT